MSSNNSVIAVKLADAPEAQLHMLPCEVCHNGAAGVSKYFTCTVKGRKHDLSVSFRGRGLKGAQLTCPQGYTGVVLQEEHTPASDQEDRMVKVASVFQQFTYWNLETPPSSDDGVAMAMTWPALAEAIHGPVDK